MLQQGTGNRNRRQDVYDLDHLVAVHDIGDRQSKAILYAFLEMSRTRHFKPDKALLVDPEARRKSSEDRDTLKKELGEIPEFNTCFERMTSFYRALPWQAVSCVRQIRTVL